MTDARDFHLVPHMVLPIGVIRVFANRLTEGTTWTVIANCPYSIGACRLATHVF